MSGEKSCRRGCCWTPQGVCARQRRCACHAAPDPALEATQAAIRAEQLARAMVATNRHNPEP